MISPVAYGLDLFPAWWIHLVFHVSNLTRFQWPKEFEREERLPSPMVVDGEEEYEVEAILKHKGKGARRLYLVMWKGYPITEVGRAGSLNCISKMLLYSWKITCAVSELRTSADAGPEETGRRVDGGSRSMRPQASWRLKDLCFLGAYVWGVITFGASSLRGWSYRLYTGDATTVIIQALVGAGPTL